MQDKDGAVIEDEKIGELWKLHQPCFAKDLCLNIRMLILKLSEERALRLYERDPSKPYSLERGAKEFGIDSIGDFPTS